MTTFFELNTPYTFSTQISVDLYLLPRTENNVFLSHNTTWFCCFLFRMTTCFGLSFRPSSGHTTYIYLRKIYNVSHMELKFNEITLSFVLQIVITFNIQFKILLRNFNFIVLDFNTLVIMDRTSYWTWNSSLRKLSSHLLHAQSRIELNVRIIETLTKICLSY
jgi:hypothetical protein